MSHNKFDRRNFIRKTAAGAVGIGLTVNKAFPLTDQTEVLPKIKDYRRLGRTNAMVSDIGSGVPYSESVLKAVIASGVNFIETAESYDNGNNESLIGNALGNIERESLFITTKINTSLGIGASQDDIYNRAEASRKRLGTAYIDLYMMHQAQSIVKVGDKNFHKACDKLKKEGKIRFRGLSCHGSLWWQEQGGSLEDILLAAVEDGRYDVLFFPYNFLDPEMGERVLKVCKANDIGTMIMKSNPIGVFEGYERVLSRGEDLSMFEKKDYETKKVQMEKARSFFSKYNMTSMDDLKKGAYRYILSNENVSTICCRFRTFADIDLYVNLSGKKLDGATAKMLSDFRESMGFLNCRIGCNRCEGSCPVHMPVGTILRYYYYTQYYNEKNNPGNGYKELISQNPGACADCAGECEKSCPHNVAARSLLLDAHRILS
ncbi:MAG: aldo/keto reductase [Bacteroidales bacterium]|jgi:predicted aldo/keto reductase-like oxidoreductase|nr:aldo/keto reductase [Bacteroidales bacterium]